MDSRTISDFTDQEMLVVLERLINYNVVDAARLSLTCRFYYDLFTQALADKLLLMLIEVTYLKKAPIPEIMQSIQQLVELRPDLIFVNAQSKNYEHDSFQKDSPITYVFKYLDVHFVKMFEKIAIEQKRTLEFLTLAQQGFDNHFDLVEHIRLATEEYLEADKKLNTEENPLPPELSIKAKEIIGYDQYDLVRWMFDAALQCNPGVNPDVDYNDTTPCDKYIVNQLHGYETIDLLAFEEGKKLGKDLTLTHMSKLGFANSNGILFTCDVLNNCTFFSTLYQEREKMAENVIKSNCPTISSN